jgi:diguanylate cyclase (GGDEF)-like protein
MTGCAVYPNAAEEEQRLRELERYGLAGSEGDEHLRRILELACLTLEAPMAAILLAESGRVRVLAGRGLELSALSCNEAFCPGLVGAEDVLMIQDATLDPRLSGSSLVTGTPHVRFLAAAPLRTPTAHNIGSLVVMDTATRGASASQLGMLGSFAALTMRELELRQRAHLCPVTGCAARGAFLEIGESEFRRSRGSGEPLSLFCFDLDNLRQINNRWGHEAGNQVLRDCCTLCRRITSARDYVARIGDGEFALLLIGVGRDQALAIAEDIRAGVRRLPGAHSHSDFKLHISGGVTNRTDADQDFVSMLRRADQALELAKTNGRDQIAVLS